MGTHRTRRVHGLEFRAQGLRMRVSGFRVVAPDTPPVLERYVDFSTSPTPFRVSCLRGYWRRIRHSSCTDLRPEMGGLVFKAHRLLHHSTLGLRVIKKTKKMGVVLRGTPPRVGQADTVNTSLNPEIYSDKLWALIFF